MYIKIIMPGGLIQVATYGSQDLFLTGTPEITFFKTVYRRHTPFAIESLAISFDDPVGFGKISSITIPKVGDLIHKMYLEVNIPQIQLERFDTDPSLKPIVDAAERNYITCTNFMSINRLAYVSASEINDAQNITDSTQIIKAVNDVFDSSDINIINQFKQLMEQVTPKPPFTYNEVNMQSVASLYSENDSKAVIFDALTVALNKSIKVQNYFFTTYRDIYALYLNNINPLIKFAWVRRLGHAIVEKIEMFIGGQKVDKSYGDWLNIWYELTSNRDLEDSYLAMIGDIPELTTFDRTIKPKYTLRIPLQFWFNRYSGLALPLVALQYHDVRFEIQFRKLEDVSYVEDGKTIKYSETGEGLFLDEVTSELGIDISARLLIDYIYLNSPERHRFAQSSHEYLIEQLQILELPDISDKEIQIVLNNFVHPSKELVWVAQKISYTENLTGFNVNRWDNYSLTDENRGRPIKYSKLDFQSYNRIMKLDTNYFNYVQPYQHHTTTPSDGINVYCFSVFPEEHQPSSTANLSRISRVLLTLYFDDIQTTEMYNVRIYTHSYNILRLISGMAGLAYTFG
jgi:hypothetical protein